MNQTGTNSRSRLWLLVPKVVAAAIYLGALTAVVVIWLSSGIVSMRIDDPHRIFIIEQTRLLLVFLVVPALLAAIGLGVALLLRSPGYFLRARWLQLKLISLAILVPCEHFFCRSRMEILRAATDQSISNAMAMQLSWAFSIALVGSIVVLAVARFKPRWGIKLGLDRPDDSPGNVRKLFNGI